MQDGAALETLRQLIPRCLLPDQIRLGHALLRAREQPERSVPLARWLAEARASVRARARRARILRGIAYPPELPITGRREEILAALRAHRVVIVAGETGSGKTTQLPKLCLEAGLGLRARIGCTQPRRVAALAISRRLAEELGVPWGREVGCKIRFADHTAPETAVKVMTDGILLAELQGDPLLAEYEAIILDEAHERSLNIDFLLGHLRQLLARRDDLKLVITSATLDTDLFARAFGGAPVLEVSGRMYPVEVRYAPPDEQAEARGEVTYIDAAVNAVERLLEESPLGDVLVFMPTERDIRETCERLEERRGGREEIVPLFGRLAAGDQQRVFAPGPRRRVVVATNIAETSLTVPRIRYVVDTGLARVSRYSPGTRTHRLPVEPVSQSSANQRKGRCGRVAEGVCVRLYSEADFASRRPFTEPEIRRCDLAEVILRLKARGLGEVETFPFPEPPAPAAIRAAYQLLHELGALDEHRALTPIGRDLARLPVDPAIGRMLLQARVEGVLPEVLIIAAGLSIQDPRERPLEEQAAADASHRRFQHPQSDFLTLLHLWNAYHDQWEALRTQNQMRQFCRTHFLSFPRMREWQEVQAELAEAVAELEALSAPVPPGATAGPQPPPARRWRAEPAFEPRYAAIHRAILTGLWGHVLHREERNLYRAAGGRPVVVFPGSGLYIKSGVPQSSPKAAGRSSEAATPRPAQPEWLVAGEIVETTRTYARTVAAIDPEWVIELAPHLVRVTHDQVRWDPVAGRVLARERVLFRGLVLREQTVGYGRVHPAEATEVFLRTALVAASTSSAEEHGQFTAPAADTDGEQPGAGQRAPAPPPRARRFLEHNRRLREKIEFWQTRLRHRVAPDLDEALYQFYAARLTGVSSWADLERVLKTASDPDFLCATAAALLGEPAAAFATDAFPDQVSLAGRPVPVTYTYAPGREDDGVTLRLTAPLAERVDASQLDWVVPALREERLAHLLRELPRALRRALPSAPEAAREIAAAVAPGQGAYLAAVSAFIRQRWGVDVPESVWPAANLPAYLRPRVELVSRDGRPLAAGRDFEALREQARIHRTPGETRAWEQAVQQWERYELRAWDFGDLPETVTVADPGDAPLRAWPGLQIEHHAVHLRLFRDAAEARAATRAAVPRLAELMLQRELAAVQKDLRSLRAAAVLYATLGPGDELLDAAWECLRRHLLPAPEPPPRTAAEFGRYLEDARSRVPGAVPRLVAAVGAILEERQALLVYPRPFAGLHAELNALVPRRFPALVPWERLPHLPRYLRALRVRAERAVLNPAKDAEKVNRVRPFAEALRALAPRAHTPGARAAWHWLRWLIEEYKVAVFAPELGTAEKVSPPRLEAAVAEVRRWVETGG